MKCIKCNKEISDDSIFCKFCGKKQVATSKKVVKEKRRRKGSGSITRRKNCNRFEARYKGTYLGNFGSYEEADEALMKYKLSDAENNEYYNYTVQKVFDCWKAESFDKLTDRAKKQYESVFNNYFKEIQSIKMKDTKAVHYQRVVNNAAELYGYDICAKIRTVARGLCEQAMKNDIIDKNYGALISLPPKQKPIKNIFNKEQIKALWKHKDIFEVKIILILIYTGIRPGELFTTDVSNVFIDKKYFVTGIKTEAGKNRPVPIAECVLPLFKEIYSMAKSRRKSKLLEGIITQEQFTKQLFHRALLECEIISTTEDRALTPYSCRHTFFSIQKQLKTDPALLTSMFGHADEEVGNKNYYHPQIEEKLAAVNQMQDFLNKKVKAIP